MTTVNNSTASAISINKFIYDILINDERLSQMTNKQIYPIVAEDTVNYPFVIFTKNDVRGEYTKDIHAYDVAELQVAVAATNYFQTVEIAERIRQLLEGRRDGYFRSITLEGVTEEYMDDAFVQSLTFQCKIMEK